MMAEKVKLKFLVKLIASGGRPKGGAVSSGVFSIGAEHLNGNGGFNFEKSKYIPTEYYQNIGNGKIQFNDILVVKDGATTGKVSLVDETFPFKDAAINEHVFRLVLNAEKINHKYCFYYLVSETGQREILLDFRGATVGGITKGFLDNIEIPLPSLEKQQQIAHILDKADALRQKNRELLRQYDALAQAIFIEMFGDPVQNEKGWKKVPFNDLFDTRLGKMLDAKKQIGNPRYKYLGNSNVQWFRFQLDNLLEMEFDGKELKTFELKENDILICEGGEVGRAAIWKNEISNVFFQKAIHRARIKTHNITPLYTVMLLWFFAKYGGLKDYVTASTIAHLTGEKLKTLPVPLPPYEQQILFSQQIESLNHQKKILENGMNHSETLFQSLLQGAFEGRL